MLVAIHTKPYKKMAVYLRALKFDKRGGLVVVHSMLMCWAVCMISERWLELKHTTSMRRSPETHYQGLDHAKLFKVWWNLG
jgi:hypothetical protein